ncbi:MAG: response regulator, partial [Armatimonadetes bacterium]|nr:response regulator [Armatimonadota bacterium]
LFNYFVIVAHERDMLREEAKSRAKAIVTVLAAASENAIASLNTHDLQLAADQVKQLKDVDDVAVINREGAVEAGSDIETVGRKLDEPLVTAALTSGQQQEDFNATGSGTLTIVEPVKIGDKTAGAVKIVLSLSHLRAALAASRNYIFALTAVLVVGAVAFMFWLADFFTGPILAVASTARKVAGGDLERKVKVVSSDEIGVLADSINEMSARLRGMIDQERAAREKLQHRVEELLRLAERVSGGELTVPPAPEGTDEMGRLSAGFNDMVRNLRLNMETQRATLYELEESSHALAEANRQLKELDRLKSEFLNTVSHELRTPLTSIKAFSEILLDNDGDDRDTQREFLGIINQESDRLTRLINNLLDLSRIEAGRMQWEMEPIRLREVTDACVNATRALVEKKGLSMTVKVPDDIGTVGDRDKLIQVVTNLISNAVKFTDSGGSITLSGAKIGDELSLSVIDTGRGIPREYHEKVFEKFQQVDTSSTREIKGSGLGLPIVRSIVEAHGGTVKLDSEPGRGSTFTVVIPAADLSHLKTRAVDPAEVLAAVQAAFPQSASAEPPPTEWVEVEKPGESGKNRRILVVDDEPTIMRVMRHILESEGYTVLEAANGMEALARAREERPDLVLLDVLLPDIDGFEVLERMRRDPQTADLPVVVLSILEAKERSFRLGAQDYFNKPIDRGKLVETVQALLGEGNQEIKILVADDDPHILQAVASMLSSRGYRVITARDGLEAVVKAREEIPNLLVLDLYMPEMDGFEVIRKLRAWDQTSHIPILVLTASDIALDEARALTLGAARFMNKPFSENELARMVREALTRVIVSKSAVEKAAEGRGFTVG